jgi:hypothetical protein
MKGGKRDFVEENPGKVAVINRGWGRSQLGN